MPKKCTVCLMITITKHKHSKTKLKQIMSIDLSKAKIGDKFRTKLGYVVIFTGLCRRAKKYKYTFERVDDKYCGFCCDINGVSYGNNEMYTIVEQVFDESEKDIATLERDERINLDMANVVRDIENKQQELQRRQEVVELADRIFTEKYLQEWYQYLIDNKTIKTDYVTYIFEWAEKFVNAKDKYLKEGKL